MPRFAANLSMLWPELATPGDRIDAAARAGFDAVEILFVHELDLDALGGALTDAGVELVLFDADPGNWAAGERGLLCLADEERFRRSVIRAAADAHRLGTRLVNLLAGIAPLSADPARLAERCRERLDWACRTFGGPELSFVVEAINGQDMPGYLLAEPQAAADLVGSVGSPWLGVQFDAYHAGMVGLDPRAVLAEQAGLIRHVQVADVPGRHEPGTGGLDLIGLLEDLDAHGFTGWVGCEYRPSADTESALGWMRPRWLPD